ncbi:MAG: hypothetical protein OHK0046_21040 [Anaerolineae bacterium]
MANDDQDEKEPLSEMEKLYGDIRERISKRYESRMEFTIHVAFFVIATIGLFFMWNNELATLFLRNVCTGLLGLWFFGLVGHVINFAFEEMRENAIERELQRVGLLTPHQIEKAKHPPQRLVMLGEDGELVEYPDSNEDEGRRAKTR